MSYRIPRLRSAGKIVLVLAAVVVIQAVLAFRFQVFGFFDLPLIVSVYYGFTLSNPMAAIFIGSGLGLMQDSLSGAALGTNGFSKTLIAVLAASAGSKFNVDQTITRIAALFLFTVADGLMVSILSLLAGAAPDLIYSEGLGGWVLSAAFNILAGLVLLGYHDRSIHATT